MKYLADTDFLVDLYRGRKAAKDKLKLLKKEEATISTSTITAAELYEGAYKSHNVSSSILKVETLLNSFRIIDFNLHHARNFGELITRLRGEEIGDIDTLIASIAISEGCEIITNNSNHFERTGVPLVSW